MAVSDIVLFFLSTAISIILSYWGIIASKRMSKHTELCLFEESTIYLLSQFKDKFNSLSVEYNHQTISKNLAYFQASVINCGTSDIDRSRIYKPLQLCLPENYKFLEYKLTTKTNNSMEASLSINENVVEVSWDLLKENEGFAFELIIECPFESNARISKVINLAHRIADVKSIDIYTSNAIPSIALKSKRKEIRDTIFKMVFIYIAAIAMIFYGVKYLTGNRIENIEVFNEILGKDYQPVELKAIDSKTAIISSTQGSDTVAINELSKHVILKPEFRKNNSNMELGVLFLLLGGIVLFGTVRSAKDDIEEWINDYKAIKIKTLVHNPLFGKGEVATKAR